ncbi:hypothetical protein [Actinomadura sp. 6N118]|uniref:hypothetical protein n=1 Tax=Actinomadura sp. 6N118 TaxID=3375151 RepID=UPI00379E6D25
MSTGPGAVARPGPAGVRHATVPTACLGVLGDNPKESYERHYGYIPADRLIALVVRRMRS